MLDAWMGAAKWANQDAGSQFAKSAVTRAEYAEMGGDYIKEHHIGNIFRMVRLDILAF